MDISLIGVVDDGKFERGCIDLLLTTSSSFHQSLLPSSHPSASSLSPICSLLVHHDEVLRQAR